MYPTLKQWGSQHPYIVSCELIFVIKTLFFGHKLNGYNFPFFSYGGNLGFQDGRRSFVCFTLKMWWKSHVSTPRLLEIALKQYTSTYMFVLQCNYMYLYHISFMHITVNKLSIKHNQSRHRLHRHSSHRLTHHLPWSVPLSLDCSIHHHIGMCRMKYKPCWRFGIRIS